MFFGCEGDSSALEGSPKGKAIKRFYSFQTFVSTHGVQISEALIHLGVAEDGVTFTHPPQHAFKGLHLHPLDETGHEAVARAEQSRAEQV